MVFLGFLIFQGPKKCRNVRESQVFLSSLSSEIVKNGDHVQKAKKTIGFLMISSRKFQGKLIGIVFHRKTSRKSVFFMKNEEKANKLKGFEAF